MQDLSVTADYSRYRGTSTFQVFHTRMWLLKRYIIGVQSTLTIERGRQAGKAFAYKLMQSVHYFLRHPLWLFCRLAKTRRHIIYSDRDLNPWHVIHLNIYQNFLVTAVKMHEYLQDWGPGRWINYIFLRSKSETVNSGLALTSKSQVSLRKPLLTTIHLFGFRADERKMKTEFARRPSSGELYDPRTRQGNELLCSLGHHAFLHVLSRKPTRYGTILKWLGLEIRRGKYRRYLRKFRTVVKEGQAGLAHIV